MSCFFYLNRIEEKDSKLFLKISDSNKESLKVFKRNEK